MFKFENYVFELTSSCLCFYIGMYLGVYFNMRQFLRLHWHAEWMYTSECIFLYSMCVFVCKPQSIVSIRLELCTADWFQEPFPYALTTSSEQFQRRDIPRTIADMF